MNVTPKLYFVEVRLIAEDGNISARLVEDAKLIDAAVDRVSASKEMIPPKAERSFAVLAYLLKSDRSAREIADAIKSPGTRDNPQRSGTNVRDKIMVLELGNDFSFTWLDGPATWLARQRN